MRRIVLLGILLTAGCSSGSNGGTTTPTDTVTLEIEPWTVAAHEDRIWCKTMKVPSDVTLDVSKFTTTMPDGSHHFILYTSDNDLPDGFGDCTEMNDRMFIMGSQTPGTTVSEYGPGLALPLFAGQQLILETHYANAADVAIEATVQVELTIIPHEEVVDYVQTLLIPYTGFTIPPHSTNYVDGMTVPETAGFNVISATSHAHKRMTYFKADRITPSGSQQIFEDYDWHSPHLERFTPPMTLQSGNDIRFECTWTNETDNPIQFGPTTEDEMCILVLTFFPAYSWSP